MSYQYSFTATDTVCIAWFNYSSKEGIKTSPSFELQFATCSFSVYEPHIPVYTLGRKSQQGTTSSFRNIQGTLIFNIINKHPLFDLLNWAKNKSWAFSLDQDDSSSINLSGNRPPISTVLPPFNLTFFSTVEYLKPKEEKHYFNTLTLHNVQLNANGLVLSVNNIMTEQTYNFISSHYSELETEELELQSLVNNFINSASHTDDQKVEDTMSLIERLRGNYE